MEWFADNGWVAWVGLALVLAAIEVATVTFFFLMLAGGALAGAVAAAVGLSLPWQVVVAVAVALALTFLARPPLARRMTSAGATAGIGPDANIGREALVLEPVTGHGGQVKLAGEVWTARTTDNETLLPGRTVRVVSLDGATVVVSAAGTPAERL